MVRLSLVAFLALALSGIALAAPREIAAARGTASLTYKNCAKPEQINSVNISPASPKVRQDITLQLNIHVEETIGNSPTVTVQVSPKDGSRFPTYQNYDLCQAAGCPIPPGDLKFGFSINLPGDGRAGKYEISAYGHNADERVFFCFDEAEIEVTSS